MGTSRAVETILRSVLVREGLYGGGEWCEGPPRLIGALITHLARHGVSDWCL